MTINSCLENTKISNKIIQTILIVNTAKCLIIFLKYSFAEDLIPYLNALYGSYHIQVTTVEQIVPNKIPATPKSKTTR